jgi:hypothetical protein
MAGVFLSIIIFFAILLIKYQNSLLEAIEKSELIRINTLKMKQATKHMDSTIEKINNLLPMNYSSASHRELLLLALDDIKMTIRESEITVTNFEEKDGSIFLPVVIKFPVNDYVVLIRMIGYLQSMNFPSFSIKNILIGSKAEGQIEFILCTIEGSLQMPAEKLMGVKY